jgi:predicted Fe-Mo cluster-binding NifX family protein
MKIAISTKGTTPDSAVDPRFGRTAGFLLFDTDTGNFTYLDNAAHREMPQSAGIQCARMLCDAGTQVLITGQIGPKAVQVLNQAGIQIYMGSGGTVQGALQALRQNQLQPLTDEAVQPGPGKMGGRGMGGGGGRGMGGGGMGGGGGRGMGSGGRGAGN